MSVIVKSQSSFFHSRLKRYKLMHFAIKLLQEKAVISHYIISLHIFGLKSAVIYLEFHQVSLSQFVWVNHIHDSCHLFRHEILKISCDYDNSESSYCMSIYSREEKIKKLVLETRENCYENHVSDLN